MKVSSLRFMFDVDSSGNATDPGVRSAYLYPVAVIGYFICVTLILWLPSLVRSGFVFERDPSFFLSVRVDVGWTMGSFSFFGGASNIANQGLFYAPYGVLAFIIHNLGLGPAAISKLIPIVVSFVGLIGAYCLIRDLSISRIASLVGATFFLLNPWSLNQFGYFYLWTGYCLLPLTILGIRKILRCDKTPPWFPIVLLFLGGIEAWIVTLLVTTATIVFSKPNRVRRKRHSALVIYSWFIGSGMYWIPAYTLWVIQTHSSSLKYPSTGGVLESRAPLSNLFELQDSWWPAILPKNAVGVLYANAAMIVTAVVVGVGILCLVDYVVYRPRRLSEVDSAEMKNLRIFLICAVIGISLGEGTSGLFGPVYSWIHMHLPPHDIVASLTRSPANLAGPFVLSVTVGLAYAVFEVKNKSTQSNMSKDRNNFGIVQYKTILILSAMIFCCTPSIAAFWAAYRPISIPRFYGHLTKSKADGTALELADWNPADINKNSGVWRFYWSSRMFADPTVFAAAIDQPSLSPHSSAVAVFDREVFDSISKKSSSTMVVATARAIGIHSIYIEDDLQAPATYSVEVNKVIAGLQQSGIKLRRIGREFVASIPGVALPEIWSSSCELDRSWIGFGMLHIDCNVKHAMSKNLPEIETPFHVGSFVSEGVKLSSVHTIAHGLGEKVTVVSGESGWIIDPEQMAAVLGGGASFGAVVLPVIESLRRKRNKVSGLRENHKG